MLLNCDFNLHLMIMTDDKTLKVLLIEQFCRLPVNIFSTFQWVEIFAVFMYVFRSLYSIYITFYNFHKIINSVGEQRHS